jgi:hypothetical protein
MNKAIYLFDNYLISYKAESNSKWIVWNIAPLGFYDSLRVVKNLESQGYQTKMQYNGEQLK